MRSYICSYMLSHVISGEPVQGWKTMDDLQEKRKAEIGDYVAYNDWIGQVRQFSYASEWTDSSRPPLRLLRLVNSPHLNSKAFLIISFRYSTTLWSKCQMVNWFAFQSSVVVSPSAM